MAWKPVGGMAPTWDPEMGPKSIQGYLVERKEVDTKDTMKGGNAKRKSWIYTLRQDNGSLIGFWGSKVIDMRMQGDDGNGGVKEGAYIRVSYMGKAKNPNTGMTFKNFLIEESDNPAVDGAPSSVDEDDEEEEVTPDGTSVDGAAEGKGEEDIPF